MADTQTLDEFDDEPNRQRSDGRGLWNVLAIAVVVVGLSATFAFVKVNSQPFYLFILNAFKTLRRPDIRAWRQMTGAAAKAGVSK